jgi:hypothetical protein
VVVKLGVRTHAISRDSSCRWPWAEREKTGLGLSLTRIDGVRMVMKGMGAVSRDACRGGYGTLASLTHRATLKPTKSNSCCCGCCGWNEKTEPVHV